MLAHNHQSLKDCLASPDDDGGGKLFLNAGQHLYPQSHFTFPLSMLSPLPPPLIIIETYNPTRPMTRMSDQHFAPGHQNVEEVKMGGILELKVIDRGHAPSPAQSGLTHHFPFPLVLCSEGIAADQKGKLQQDTTSRLKKPLRQIAHALEQVRA